MVRRMLRLRVLLPALVIIAFFAGGWTLRNKLEADRQGKWVRVERGDIVSGLEVTGTLAARDEETIGPPKLPDVWNFKISMMASEGAEVKKGQPILGFDTTDLQRRLDEQTAERDQAQKEIEKKRADLAIRREEESLHLAEVEANLRKLDLKLEAPADLLGIKERKQAEIDQALAKRETTAVRARIADLERAANAEILLLESRRQQAARNVVETEGAISQMTVLAPRDGTVVYVMSFRTSEKKKVGDNCWKGERILEVPDLTRILARGEVDEVDAGKVLVGQRVTLRLEAHPDEEFHGTIRTAGRTVQLAQGTKDPLKVLRVDIALDRNDPAAMRPGMRFLGTVELTRVRGALLVPRDAIFMSPNGPMAYRRGLSGVKPVLLRLGRENEKSVQVLAGLDARDRVLIAGNESEPKAAQ